MPDKMKGLAGMAENVFRHPTTGMPDKIIYFTVPSGV